VHVSAAPAPAGPQVPVDPRTPEQRAADEAAAAVLKGRRRLVGAALGAVLVALALSASPPAFLMHFTVFALAVIIGYYVISNVTHALHTPLMAQTNAISGIIVVGALLQIGNDNLAVTVLAVIAAAVASINVFGGFLVTYRMLGMFRKDA